MTFIPATDREMDVADVDSIMDHAVMTDFVTHSTVFLKMRDRAKKLKTQQDGLRDDLMKFIEEYGYEDEGSQILDLPKTIMGITKMVRQRRASRKFNDTKAEALLRSKGLWERCTQTVQVLDEDAIMVALAEGALSDEDIEEIFPLSITYALVPSK